MYIVLYLEFTKKLWSNYLLHLYYVCRNMLIKEYGIMQIPMSLTVQFEGYTVMCICCDQSILENCHSNYISRCVVGILYNVNEEKKKIKNKKNG